MRYLLVLLLLFPVFCRSAAAASKLPDMSCKSEIAVYSISQESYKRSCGLIASLDEAGTDEFLTFRLNITYNDKTPLKDALFEVSVDGSKKYHWYVSSMEKGGTLNMHVYNVNMQRHSQTGAHTVTWYLNGTQFYTQSFTFTKDVNWDSIMRLPTAQQITSHNATAKYRAPYLAGWAKVPGSRSYTDLVLDFKGEFVAPQTYLCPVNIYMDLSSLRKTYNNVRLDGGPSFYAGVQCWKTTSERASIMSFWDILYENQKGETKRHSAVKVYPDDSKISQPFTGEGTGVHHLDDYPWEDNVWYRFMVRCITYEKGGNVHVEQWIQNLKTQVWTHLCTYDTGLKDTCFINDFCFFLENYNPGSSGYVRSMEIANIRVKDKKSGKWLPVTRASIGVQCIGFPYYQGRYGISTMDDRFLLITTGADDTLIDKKEPQTSKVYTVQSTQTVDPY